MVFECLMKHSCKTFVREVLEEAVACLNCTFDRRVAEAPRLKLQPHGAMIRDANAKADFST